jgi:hypothetical protein
MTPARLAPGTSDVDILSRAFEVDEGKLSAPAARWLLGVHFTRADQDRMNDLAEKARQGTLTAEEQVQIDNYERAGHVLSLLKLKARLSLKRSTSSNGRRRT